MLQISEQSRSEIANFLLTVTTTPPIGATIMQIVTVLNTLAVIETPTKKDDPDAA